MMKQTRHAPVALDGPDQVHGTSGHISNLFAGGSAEQFLALIQEQNQQLEKRLREEMRRFVEKQTSGLHKDLSKVKKDNLQRITEIARLNKKTAALSSENTALNEKTAARSAENTALKNTVDKLSAQVTELKGVVSIYRHNRVIELKTIQDLQDKAKESGRSQNVIESLKASAATDKRRFLRNFPTQVEREMNVSVSKPETNWVFTDSFYQLANRQFIHNLRFCLIGKNHYDDYLEFSRFYEGDEDMMVKALTSWWGRDTLPIIDWVVRKGDPIIDIGNDAAHNFTVKQYADMLKSNPNGTWYPPIWQETLDFFKKAQKLSDSDRIVVHGADGKPLKNGRGRPRSKSCIS